MPTPDDIRNQLEQLVLHRQNIQHFRRQQLAHGGAAQALPVTQHGLIEAVAGAAHCKAVLRSWGAHVENLPDDDPPGVLTVAQATARLHDLPADENNPIPAPQMLPDPHRIILSPNPLFVGREHDLRTLAARLKEGESIAVTTGIGGVGEKQLAVELAHRAAPGRAVGQRYWSRRAGRAQDDPHLTASRRPATTLSTVCV